MPLDEDQVAVPPDADHDRDSITIKIVTKIRRFQRLHVLCLRRLSDGDRTLLKRPHVAT